MTETKVRSYQWSVRKDYNTKDLRLGWQSFSFVESFNDKPENGLKGLRYWCHDLSAGFGAGSGIPACFAGKSRSRPAPLQ
jgi:hypothetical protein